jgi:hypothetical protein
MLLPNMHVFARYTLLVRQFPFLRFGFDSAINSDIVLGISSTAANKQISNDYNNIINKEMGNTQTPELVRNKKSPCLFMVFQTSSRSTAHVPRILLVGPNVTAEKTPKPRLQFFLTVTVCPAAAQQAQEPRQAAAGTR